MGGNASHYHDGHHFSRSSKQTTTVLCTGKFTQHTGLRAGLAERCLPCRCPWWEEARRDLSGGEAPPVSHFQLVLIHHRQGLSFQHSLFFIQPSSNYLHGCRMALYAQVEGCLGARGRHLGERRRDSLQWICEDAQLSWCNTLHKSLGSCSHLLYESVVFIPKLFLPFILAIKIT